MAAAAGVVSAAGTGGGGGVAPGSYPLSEVAVVKMRGGDIPQAGSREEEVILAAWKMYRYVSARAMREGESKVWEKADWHTWTGSLETVAHSLWPAGQTIIRGEDWLHGYQMARNWLFSTRDVVSTDTGRPGTSTRKEGMVAPRLPHWLIRDRFTGAPDGMRLPDLDDDGRPISIPDPDPAPAPLAPEPVPTPTPPALAGAADWWCPIVLSGNCQREGPYTREGLGTHIQKYHGYKRGGMMYDVTIGDADSLREDRAASPPPPPAPEPPARSIMEMVTALSPPATSTARHRDRSQRHAVAPAPPAAAPVGSTAAQARVFAGQVADLEAEVVSLRAERDMWRDRATRAEAGIRLCQQDIDAIAHRTAAAVVRSIDGATS